MHSENKSVDLDITEANLSFLEPLIKPSLNRNEMLENTFIKNAILTIEKQFNNNLIDIDNSDISEINEISKKRLDLLDCILKEFNNNLKQPQQKLIATIQNSYNNTFNSIIECCNKFYSLITQ